MKNILEGEKRSTIVNKANKSVPAIKPNCTAEVKFPKALAFKLKCCTSSFKTAFPANHKEVQQNWAITIMGSIAFFFFISKTKVQKAGNIQLKSAANFISFYIFGKMKKVKIIECPRDAMQGIKSHFISTETKALYINELLNVGFDTIDFGSFVSPKAIPQMRDTAAVLSKLDRSKSESKLLAIIANVRGAKEASQFEEIDYLGYPFSISENFQMRNTHKTIEESLATLDEILNIAENSKKEVVAYLSMGFGNPYGDPWNVDIVGDWTEKLSTMGVKILSLSDTIGSSTPEVIDYLFSHLIPAYPTVEFGAHLHTTPDLWHEKVNAAFKAGCNRFDGAIKGYGGCPMAKDELTGNMPTEKLLSYFNTEKVNTTINPKRFESVYNSALEVFKTPKEFQNPKTVGTPAKPK